MPRKPAYRYRLQATRDWPALIIDGFLMHRLKQTSPMRDAGQKAAALRPRRGWVLDTCFGLGYSSRCLTPAVNIVAIERDGRVLQLAAANPASLPLLSQNNLYLLQGDSYSLLPVLPGSFFSFLLHDPPDIVKAGLLYSTAFFEHMFRVLKRGGRGFVYAGAKKPVTRGVQRRLCRVGFSVRPLPRLDGFLILKR